MLKVTVHYNKSKLGQEKYIYHNSKPVTPAMKRCFYFI